MKTPQFRFLRKLAVLSALALSAVGLSSCYTVPYPNGHYGHDHGYRHRSHQHHNHNHDHHDHGGGHHHSNSYHY